MSGKNRNITLSSYEELFQTEDQRQKDNQERVQKLPLDMFYPFPNRGKRDAVRCFGSHTGPSPAKRRL